MANGQFLKGHAKEKGRIYRILTIFFGVDLLIIGLVTIIASAVIIHHYKKYLDFADPKYLGGVAFCLIVGVVVFLVGILGLYGATKEKIGSLQAFFILILVLLFMDILGGSLCLAYRTRVDTAVDHSLNRGINEYYTVHKTKDFFDWLHKEYKCCGLSGPGDWTKSNSSNVKGSTQPPPITTSLPSTNATSTKGVPVNATTVKGVPSNATTVKGVPSNATTVAPTTSNQNIVNEPAKDASLQASGGIPASCCRENSKSASCTSKADNVYQKGCRKDFEDLIHYLLGVVGTIAFFCAIIELIGICITYVYLLGVKESIYQTIS